MEEKFYTDLAVKVQEVDSRGRSNEHRLEEHDKEIKGLREDTKTLIRLTNNVETIATSVADVNDKVDKISDKQDKLNDKVTILENRPAAEIKKRFDGIYDKIAWIVVGGVIVSLLSQILPGITW